jgi:hypothetical protein
MSDLDNEVNVTFKIYPTRYKNSRGFYIGKYAIDLKSKNSPTGLLTEVDFYLNSLFKNMINDMKPNTDKKKQDPDKIVPVIVEKWNLSPGKYRKSENNTMLKGGVKTRIKRSKRQNNNTRRKKKE